MLFVTVRLRTARRWQLRSAARSIESASSRRRAEILEECLTFPGTVWRVAPEVLPDDLPPEWLGLFLGFVLSRKNLLAVREEKRLRTVAAGVRENWLAMRFPRYELTGQAAAEVADRLATMRRLTGAESLFAYLAKAAKGAAGDTRRRDARIVDALSRRRERGRRIPPAGSADSQDERA